MTTGRENWRPGNCFSTLETLSSMKINQQDFFYTNSSSPQSLYFLSPKKVSISYQRELKKFISKINATVQGAPKLWRKFPIFLLN